MFLPRSVSKRVSQQSRRPCREPLQPGADKRISDTRPVEDVNRKPENNQDAGEMGEGTCAGRTPQTTVSAEAPSESSARPSSGTLKSAAAEGKPERCLDPPSQHTNQVQRGNIYTSTGSNSGGTVLEKPQISSTNVQTEQAEAGSCANIEEDPVVSYSKDQRWPEAGEPVCVVCGRYGEYICDKTEVDVCSLECKARNLARQKQDHKGNDLRSEEKEAEDRGEEAQVLSYTFSECLEISRLSREQVQDIRTEFDIFVEGIDVPRPVLSFEQLFLPLKLLQNLKEVGFLTPTPVQMQIIPAALKGRDLMVSAQTSSGKTASFLIPSILHVLMDRHPPSTPQIAPVILILTPTRELAQQIEVQAKSLMRGIPNMRTALLVGGLPLPPQLHRLKQNIQMVIATPGRLLELIRDEDVRLSSIKLLVIDEVDSMLQFGFQKQVEDIRGQLSGTRQTMLFSATIPTSIERISEDMLIDPVYVSVGTPSTPCSSVKQVLLWVEEPSKKKKLFNLLEDRRHYQPPVLIFVDSKAGADLLASAIEKVFGLDVGSIHGDKSQVERGSVLQSFQEGLLPILVSTGVLGRGLDLPKVKLVINFDMPKSVEEYIHQIGRTGRLGTKGTAISFINNGNKKLFLELQKTLQPLGVALPAELTNSQFLQLQKDEHQRKRGRTHPGKGWKEFKKQRR